MHWVGSVYKSSTKSVYSYRETLEITHSFSGKIKRMRRNIAIFLVGLLAVLSTYIISWRSGTKVVDMLLVEYDYIIGKVFLYLGFHSDHLSLNNRQGLDTISILSFT